MLTRGRTVGWALRVGEALQVVDSAVEFRSVFTIHASGLVFLLLLVRAGFDVVVADRYLHWKGFV